MRILVTGGAGFIGSSAAKHFVAAGHEVAVVDDFSYGHLSNLKGVYCGLLDSDISHPDWTNNIADGYSPPDVILHLAAIAPLSDCQVNPSRAYQVNVVGTINILEYARKHGSRVLFASTSAVYESNTNMPFLVGDAISPDLIYSLTKKHAEEVIESYRRNYGMNITSFRLFNVYGPAQDGARKQPPLIPYILLQMKNNADITLYCDKPSVKRDYIYIDDAVAAIDVWLNAKFLTGGIFNICSQHGSSVQDIVDIARAIYPKYTGTIKYDKPEKLWHKYEATLFSGKNQMDPYRIAKETYKGSIGDCAATMARLKGWQPRINMYDGMKKCSLDSQDA